MSLQNAVRAYLCNGGTVAELQDKYGLNVRRHPVYNNLLLFKYDQISSRPDDHPVVVCARGLILDEANNYKIISWPFNRFFNYGQKEVEFDWTRSSVACKLDGSLLVNYFFDGKWHVQTSGSPAAEGEVQGWPYTFATLFWETFNKMGLELSSEHTNLCFMWELTSPFNRIVVRYQQPQLTLIGVRNKDTGEELSLDMFPQYPVVQTYALNNADSIIASLKDVSPVSMEGYVVRSNTRDEYGGWTRLKIKSPQYVALHHIRDQWGPRRIVEIIRQCEVAEILTAFPEWANDFNASQKLYDALVDSTISIYESIKHIENQKEFALAVQASSTPISGALYSLRAGKITSVKQYIADMNIASLMRILGLKDTVPKD